GHPPAEPAGAPSAREVMIPLPAAGVPRPPASQDGRERAGAGPRTASAEPQARLSKADRIPDLNVFLAGMHDFNTSMSVSNYLFAGFRINLPIFGGGRNRPPVSSAPAQLLAAQDAEPAPP